MIHFLQYLTDENINLICYEMHIHFIFNFLNRKEENKF